MGVRKRKGFFFIVFLVFFVLLNIGEVSVHAVGNNHVSVPGLGDPPGSSRDMLDMKKLGGYDSKNLYILKGTAYAPSAGGINCSGDCTIGAAVTKVSTHRTLAADPSVLPYGTIVRMYVPTMKEFSGLYIVEDTGGAIKDNRIDVLIEPLAKANEFGRRDVHINIVELGKGKKDARDKVSRWGEYLDKYSMLVGEEQVGVSNNSGEFEDGDEEAVVPEEDEFEFDGKDVTIKNTGVDDRQVENTAQTSFITNTILSKVANYLFDIARVVSIFVIGFIALLWTIAVLGYGGITYCYELLLKLTRNQVDVFADGLSKLFKYTGFAFLVSVIVISGLLPDMFALVYSMLSKLLDSIMRYSPF